MVTVLGERAYMGAFWNSFSSLAYAGVSISPWELDRDGMPVQIWSLVADGEEDLRADTRIRRVFEAAGKLR